MTSFKSTFGASVITAAAFVLLVGLGVWQLQRMEWKQALLADIAAGQDARPMTDLPEGGNVNYQRAELTGLIDRGTGLRLGLRTYNGQSGYHLIVPMIVDGAVPERPHIVMINLGWVPMDYTPPEYTTANIETITGTLRAPPARGWMTPDNPPLGTDAGRVIHWLDLSSISALLNAPVYPYVLEADKSGDNPPIGGQMNLSLPNNHLQYAITWFVLAGCVLVIFFLANRSKNMPESTAKESDEIH